jgi:cytochrome d ubiquinol oxidase subunit I
MVGLGLLMILLGAWSAWARWRGRLYSSRPLLLFAVAMGPAGIVAILAGWMTTEIGRQPWIVYNVMRTADGVSPHGATELGVTLALFVVVYLTVFGAGLVYLLRLIGAGPATAEGKTAVEGGPGQPRHPMRPMSAAPRASAETKPTGPA